MIQHTLSQSPSPKIERVVAGSASGVNIPWVAWLGLLSLFVWLVQSSWWSYSERHE